MIDRKRSSQREDLMRLKGCIIIAIFFSLAVLAVASPVDVFIIADAETIVYSRPAAVGGRFMTRYVHSIEKTSVEDDYRIVGERIWSWEERVLSQNAGMPIVTPRNGRLIVDDDWFRFRGGRLSWSELFYRVGNDALGMNELTVFPPSSGYYELFRLMPSKLLRFSVIKAPLFFAFINARGL